MAKATKIDLEVKKPYGNEHYEVGKFKGTGDAIISANALGKAAPSNYEYSVKATNKYAKGGHVSKGEMVWKKLSSSEKIKFLHENFTPEITPRSQETLVGKPYNFLPKNVKIKMEAKYANSENYANGGSLADTPESFPETDAMSYKKGGAMKKKFGLGGRVKNIDDAIATPDLKEELRSKMKKGDDVIHFAYTDYGGDFMDKVAIEYFEENYPKNTLSETTAYYGKNAFVFGKPATEWLEASEDYPLGFEDFESYYYEKQNEQENEDFERFLDDLKRDGYEVSDEAIVWLNENRSGYYGMTTQGLDFSYEDLTDDLKEEGLITKDEMAEGGNLIGKQKMKNLKSYEIITPNGKSHFVSAFSKKSVENFWLSSPIKKLIERKDIDASTNMNIENKDRKMANGGSTSGWCYSIGGL
jgi:hypothetical protein